LDKGEGSFAPYATGIHTSINADGPYVLVDGFEFVHETQQLDSDSLAAEHVMPNVADHGFARGYEDGVETNMGAEDAEFLEAMLRRHAEGPPVFFIKGMEALMKAVEEPL